MEIKADATLEESWQEVKTARETLMPFGLLKNRKELDEILRLCKSSNNNQNIETEFEILHLLFKRHRIKNRVPAGPSHSE